MTRTVVVTPPILTTPEDSGALGKMEDLGYRSSPR